MMNILMIEDDPDDALLLKDTLLESTLEKLRFTVADRLSMGMALARKGVFDIALLDLSLPDSHGVETVEKFTQTITDVPVIMMTGLNDDMVAESALRHGAQDYLIKGSERGETIHRAIRYAIQRHGLFKQLESANNHIMRELKTAKKIQSEIYPDTSIKIDGLSVSATICQRGYVGGDYYDIIPLSSGEYAFIVADVSGHDIASSFVTAMAKIAFSAHLPSSRSVSELLTKVNMDILKAIRSELHLTAFVAIIDPNTGNTRYASAGHVAQYIYKKNSGNLEELWTEGFLLGILDSCEFNEAERALEPGDKLVLLTDGVIESQDTKRNQFGSERLKKLIKENGHMEATELKQRVLDTFHEHRGDAEVFDDMCLVVIEYNGVTV